MMIGDPFRSNPTVQIPSWDAFDDPTVNNNISSPFSAFDFNGNITSPNDINSFTSLQRFLPSNDSDSLSDGESADSFSCDEFRMYEFKVRRCSRGRSHDWTECPFAHPGEKARRRDPRKYHYSGTACSDFRKGSCRKGDACEFAHGVFECWLHPARYRTQPCKDGTSCRRRVCFFAHTPDQLRVLSHSESVSDGSGESELGSPVQRHLYDAYFTKSVPESFVSSPTSILVSPAISPPSDSPPVSPSGGEVLPFRSIGSVSELAGSMRKLQLGRVKLGSGTVPWGFNLGSGFGSPRSSMIPPGFCSPTRTPTRSGLCHVDKWDCVREEEPVMERVESGKELRAKMYAKLGEENSLHRVDSVSPGPDLGWVSELVK